MICMIDYGVGNLFSLKSSFAAIGHETCVSSSPEDIRKADKIILPGVGAFGDAAAKLKNSGLADVIKEETAKGKPLLGICLGMQLLFEKSYEYGEHEGLGLLKGKIVPLEGMVAEGLKIPQMGWNALNIVRNSPLLSRIKNGDHVYFVHSYHATGCDDSLIAYVEYSINVTAAVAFNNVYGCQFHPEKSGDTGLKILKSFCEDI